jgi:hypothetical protein
MLTSERKAHLFFPLGGLHALLQELFLGQHVLLLLEGLRSPHTRIASTLIITTTAIIIIIIIIGSSSTTTAATTTSCRNVAASMIEHVDQSHRGRRGVGASVPLPPSHAPGHAVHVV